MDINLPGMDGIAAMKTLQTHKETRDIPVIAVSAYAMETDKKNAMAAGFKEYVTKPFNIRELLETIDGNLKKNRQRPQRIFIVDDDRDFAGSIAEVLEDHGYSVELAFSGEEAIQKFREQNFDITFMDVRMPGLNGVETFRAFRKIKPDTKVVMMTAYSVEQLLKEATDNGALGVLHKPFAMESILSAVQETKPGDVVLIVDDDPASANSTRVLLEDNGYKVMVARSGEEAIQQAEAHNVDLILLDLGLPVIDGVEIHVELKKRGIDAPTFIVSGLPDEESGNIDKLRSLRVTGCLTKPFAPEDILNAIAAIGNG